MNFIRQGYFVFANYPKNIVNNRIDDYFKRVKNNNKKITYIEKPQITYKKFDYIILDNKK